MARAMALWRVAGVRAHGGGGHTLPQRSGAASLSEEHETRLATMCSQIRPLTDTEIESLERALGVPVDREYLVRWVSQCIKDTVTSAGDPSPRQLRDSLLQIEGEARQLLRSVDEAGVAQLLAARSSVAELKMVTAQFCDQICGLAREVDALVRGRPRTPAALESFIDRMIGIAKKVKVPPSTLSRRAIRQKAETTAFFRFVETALQIAKRLIKTSQLPKHIEDDAVSKLQYQSREALVEIINKVRGNIGNYRETPHGLIERTMIEPDRD